MCVHALWWVMGVLVRPGQVRVQNRMGSWVMLARPGLEATLAGGSKDRRNL